MTGVRDDDLETWIVQLAGGLVLFLVLLGVL